MDDVLKGHSYMGLADWFSTFCTDLQVDNTGSISNRYKAITRRLNTDFRFTTSDTANSLYVGSYGRNTAIDGFSDLDMIYELPVALYYQYDAYQSNGQSSLLQAVKTSIERTYSTTSIRADGQVILVPFTDGITFEVMPAFANQDNSFTFPNANRGGSWGTTNPRPEIAAIRARNSGCNGNLVRLCRMARAWKNQWNVPIGGLLIDTLAYQFIENYDTATSPISTTTTCAEIFLGGWRIRMKSKSGGVRRAVANGSGVRACSSTRQSARTTSPLMRLLTKCPSRNGSGRRSRSGEKSLDQHSLTEDTVQARAILEGQLRESYGRVVYSHKTHEKCADILLQRHDRIRLTQIVLSALTTAGFVGAAMDTGQGAAIVGALLSALLLVLNSYTKKYDLGELAQSIDKQEATCG